MPNKTIIMGIDPGLADTGFGFIEKDGTSLKVIDFGAIKTKADQDIESRLKELYDELLFLIKKYKPTQVAIEKLFFCKNVKTAIVVGQARGVAVLAVSNCNLKIKEFTPLQVKQAATGYGKADKRQIKEMVKIILNLKTLPKSDDAADALAIAICQANSLKTK